MTSQFRMVSRAALSYRSREVVVQSVLVRIGKDIVFVVLAYFAAHATLDPHHLAFENVRLRLTSSIFRTLRRSLAAKLHLDRFRGVDFAAFIGVATGSAIARSVGFRRQAAAQRELHSLTVAHRLSARFLRLS